MATEQHTKSVNLATKVRVDFDAPFASNGYTVTVELTPKASDPFMKKWSWTANKQLAFVEINFTYGFTGTVAVTATDG